MELAAPAGPHDRAALPGVRKAFTAQAYLPALDLAGVGRLVHVVAAWGDRPGDFAPGCSGSLWEIDGRPACLQIASVRPAYRLGFGQALTSLLVWAESVLVRNEAGFQPDSLRWMPLAQVH